MKIKSEYSVRTHREVTCSFCVQVRQLLLFPKLIQKAMSEFHGQTVHLEQTQYSRTM